VENLEPSLASSKLDQNELAGFTPKKQARRNIAAKALTAIPIGDLIVDHNLFM